MQPKTLLASVSHFSHCLPFPRPPSPLPSAYQISPAFNLRQALKTRTSQTTCNRVQWFPTVLTPRLPSPHTMHTFCSPATTCLIGLQIQRCSRGSGEGTSGSAPLRGNTYCHAPCQFGTIQSLSALSVYTGCLQLLSQCGTGTEQGGFILCGLPSPMLLSHFLFNKDETVE